MLGLFEGWDQSAGEARAIATNAGEVVLSCAQIETDVHGCRSEARATRRWEFIGSHLTDVLLAGGHHVLVIDDLSTGSLRNLAHLEHHPHLERFVDTVLNRELVTQLMARADAVFHLAAAVGVRLIVERPVRTI